jgi:hypothetical protein
MAHFTGGQSASLSGHVRHAGLQGGGPVKISNGPVTHNSFFRSLPGGMTAGARRGGPAGGRPGGMQHLPFTTKVNGIVRRTVNERIVATVVPTFDHKSHAHTNGMVMFSDRQLFNVADVARNGSTTALYTLQEVNAQLENDVILLENYGRLTGAGVTANAQAGALKRLQESMKRDKQGGAQLRAVLKQPDALARFIERYNFAGVYQNSDDGASGMQTVLGMATVYGAPTMQLGGRLVNLAVRGRCQTHAIYTSGANAGLTEGTQLFLVVRKVRLTGERIVEPNGTSRAGTARPHGGRQVLQLSMHAVQSNTLDASLCRYFDERLGRTVPSLVYALGTVLHSVVVRPAMMPQAALAARSMAALPGMPLVTIAMHGIGARYPTGRSMGPHGAYAALRADPGTA